MNHDTKEKIMDLAQEVNNEFLRLKKRNASFSLRAFARRLELPVSTLFGIMSGKSSPNLKTAEKILNKINHSQDRKAYILLQIKLNTNWQNVNKKNQFTNINQDYENSSLDEVKFRFISEWWHQAILNLMELDDFQGSEHWISKRLGIEKEKVSTSLARLAELGLISVKQGKITKEISNLSTMPKAPSKYIKEFHAQMLEKAVNSIYKHDTSLRDITNVMIPTDVKKIEKARELITEFRRKMAAFLENDGEKKSVYSLSIQLFPISNEDS